MNKGSLGSTQIHLASPLKLKQKEANWSSFKRFVSNFFTDFGCYRIECDCPFDVVYIFTHKSPDDLKLSRFSLAIKEAMNGSNEWGWLRCCKIKYTINANELKRREGDRVLPCLSNVLLNVHQRYYSNKNDGQIDCRNILKQMREAVFGGYVFVFSGCFPMDCKQKQTMEWKCAIQFGAQCVQTLSADNKEGVTHCITPRMGTKKTAIACKLGIQCVHPNWLLNSSTHYMQSNPDIYRPQGYDQYCNKNTNNKRKLKKKTLPQSKKVRFNLPHTEHQDIDAKLSQFVDEFNKNKDLKQFMSNAKDIEFKQEQEEDEEQFDFDDIHKDIDNAIKHINQKDNDQDDDDDDLDDNQEIEDMLNQELESLSS
eukprot:516471_1